MLEQLLRNLQFLVIKVYDISKCQGDGDKLAE